MISPQEKQAFLHDLEIRRKPVVQAVV